jgi:integrase
MTFTTNGVRYKGVKRYVSKGKLYLYYRPTGTELPDPAEGFRKFDRAYWDAVGGGGDLIHKPRPVASPLGTVEKIVRDYLDSETFGKIATATQVQRRSLLNGWTKHVGGLRLATMKKTDIEQGLENRKATPPTANNWLYAVRALFSFAIEAKRYAIEIDPTQGVKLLAVEKSEGFPTWTETDVETFVRRWPKGTMQYRALMVLLWSGQRRSDVVTFGWADVVGDMIVFKQQKTGRKMKLPLAPSLDEVLPPRDNVVALRPLPFLMTPGEGKWKPRPFSPSYFTNWFHAACVEAGLPHLSTHGTRKLAAQRMYRAALRAGRTDALALTMAFTGHKTEKQLRVYLGDDFEQEEYAGEIVAFMA